MQRHAGLRPGRLEAICGELLPLHTRGRHIALCDLKPGENGQASLLGLVIAVHPAGEGFARVWAMIDCNGDTAALTLPGLRSGVDARVSLLRSLVVITRPRLEWIELPGEESVRHLRIDAAEQVLLEGRTLAEFAAPGALGMSLTA